MSANKAGGEQEPNPGTMVVVATAAAAVGYNKIDRNDAKLFKETFESLPVPEEAEIEDKQAYSKLLDDYHRTKEYEELIANNPETWMTYDLSQLIPKPTMV